LNIREDNGF